MSDPRLTTLSSDNTATDTNIDTHVRLMTAAKAQAQRLRSQAIREFGCGVFDGMGDVWRSGNALWERTRTDSTRTLARSAQRLQARWQAHQKQRTNAKTATTS